MMRFLSISALALGLLAALGCHTVKPPKDDDGMSWAQEPATPPTNGAIFQTGR